jgi:hypothetical protein
MLGQIRCDLIVAHPLRPRFFKWEYTPVGHHRIEDFLDCVVGYNDNRDPGYRTYSPHEQQTASPIHRTTRSPTRSPIPQFTAHDLRLKLAAMRGDDRPRYRFGAEVPRHWISHVLRFVDAAGGDTYLGRGRTDEARDTASPVVSHENRRGGLSTRIEHHREFAFEPIRFV